MAVEQDRFDHYYTIANENRKSMGRNESSHIHLVTSCSNRKNEKIGKLQEDRKDLPPKRKIRREEENLGSCQISRSIQLF